MTVRIMYIMLNDVSGWDFLYLCLRLRATTFRFLQTFRLFSLDVLPDFGPDVCMKVLPRLYKNSSQIYRYRF